ncbi:Foldase protein PrsA 1 precursor [compost metagenome]
MKNAKKVLLGLAAAVLVGGGAAGATYYVGQQNAYVATVNDQKVSAKEYNKAFEAAKKQYQARFGIDFNSPQGKPMLAELKAGVVDQLVEQTFLLAEAKRQGIKPTSEEIDAKIAEIKKQFPDDAAFKKALGEFGTTETELREQVVVGLTIETLMKDVTKDLSVSEDRLKAFYSENQAQFKHDEEVSAAHILIKTDATAKDPKEDEAKALAKIQDLLKQIRGGADFAELAKKNSEDPGSGAQGGDLGFFGKGRMVPEFEKTAFGMKDGEVSEPFKTQFGYHIIKRNEYRPARTETYDQVKEQIRENLLSQERNQAFQKWVDAQKKDAKIVVKPEYQRQADPHAGMGPGAPLGAPAGEGGAPVELDEHGHPKGSHD